MLRRKLLARLGLLVVGFITGAVVSIALLQGVLRDLDVMNADAAALIDGVQELNTRLATLEAGMQRGAEAGAPESMMAGVTALHGTLEAIAKHPAMRGVDGAGSPAIRRIRAALPELLLAAGAATPAGRSRAELTVAVHQDVAALGRDARQHVAAQQASLSHRLRALVVGLTIAALVMVNITIVVLLRTANMILRPVGELVEGSRQLAQERFDCRVQIDQDDEFGELAHAYNRLAEQLGANEQRKVQALQHLAVTLNHELNNVISVINLQVQLVDRRVGPAGDPALAAHLHDIHDNLGRIAATIASLRHVRRIVLTDYLPGEKMIDLPRSVADDDGPLVPPPPTVPVVSPPVVHLPNGRAPR